MWQPVQVRVMLVLLCIEYPLVTCTSATPVCSTREPNVLQIMAVIPTANESDIDKPSPDWKKGEEILPGAHLAIKEINDLPDLLSGHRLEVLPVRVPQCNLNEGTVPL